MKFTMWMLFDRLVLCLWLWRKLHKQIQNMRMSSFWKTMQHFKIGTSLSLSLLFWKLSSFCEKSWFRKKIFPLHHQVCWLETVACSLYDLANVVPTLAKFYHQASEAYEQACTRHISMIIFYVSNRIPGLFLPVFIPVVFLVSNVSLKVKWFLP